MHEYGFLQATVHSLHRQFHLLIEPHRQQQLPIPKLALAETLRGIKTDSSSKIPEIITRVSRRLKWALYYSTQADSRRALLIHESIILIE